MRKENGMLSVRILGKRDVTKNAGTCDERRASVIFYSYQDKTVIGETVGSSWVSGKVIAYENICIGKRYNVSFCNGYITRISEIQIPESTSGVEKSTENKDQ